MDLLLLLLLTVDLAETVSHFYRRAKYVRGQTGRHKILKFLPIA